MSHTKWQWVGHLFKYVKTCKRGRVKDFEQRSVITRLFLVDADVIIGDAVYVYINCCVNIFCVLFIIELLYMC